MKDAVATERRVLKNFVTLLGGRAAGGVLGLVATLLSARALGPAAFGIVALVQAYTLVIRGLFNVKPFEAIVRYGIPLREENDDDGLARLLRCCFAIDIASVALATSVALLAAPVMAWLAVWSAETTTLAMAYSLLLLTNGQGTASGALRVFDRFDAISLALVLANVFRLVGVLIVSHVLEPSVAGIAAVWALSQVLQNVLTNVYGWRVTAAALGAARLRGRCDFAAVSRAHPGVWRFLHVVYWQSSLDLVPKQLGTLLAGGLLGSEGAAHFRIAREFGNVVAKPALLARQAIYPDLARLLHRGDAQFARLLRNVGLLLAGPAVLATALAAWQGATVLTFALGAGYAAAAGLLTCLVAAATLELAAAPLRPAAYTLGRAGASLVNQLLAALLYVGLFAVLTPSLGLIGPGVASLAMAVVSLVGLAVVVRAALASHA